MACNGLLCIVVYFYVCIVMLRMYCFSPLSLSPLRSVLAMLCGPMSCYRMLYYLIQCYLMLCGYVMLSNAMQCYVMQCSIM